MLDEPFAGVDPIAVQDIQDIVWQLKDKNIGILITDHNVAETLKITDRAYLLFEGQNSLPKAHQRVGNNPIVRENIWDVTLSCVNTSWRNKRTEIPILHDGFTSPLFLHSYS